MRRLPPLNAVRAFEAAARLQSFSRAAAELHVTHGAISRQVRLLEDWLGIPLFVRRPGQVRLSAWGGQLLDVCRVALDGLAEGCSAIRRASRQAPVTLACPGSFLMRWLIPRLDRLQQDVPDLSLHLHATDRWPVPGAGEADAAIVFGHAPWPAGLTVTPLGGERFGPVCSPRLAGRLRRPADLGGQKLLHTASRPQAWAEWARLNRLEPDRVADGPVFDHLSYMLEAALAGLGIAIAPEILVERDLADGRLVAPLGFTEGADGFVLLVPETAAGDYRLETLRQWLMGSVGGVQE